MAEDPTSDEAVIADEPEAPEESRGRGLPRRVLRWFGIAFAALLLIIALAVAWLHTGSGRQFIVDELSKVAPASGLSVKVGRIEGSVLWSATLYDVELRDANGTLFLEVPEVDLNWRPHKFVFTGLDVRHLVLHGGTLYAVPELEPGDPDAPILPDFDIRVDRFVVDDLTIAAGLLGGRERVVDFRASADVRDGLVHLDADGEFGAGDELDLLVYAEPDGNRFDLDLEYRAPADGVLAAMVGAEEDMRIRLDGDGTWRRWEGAFVARKGGDLLAAFKVYNRQGTYTIVGQARPEDFLTGMPAQALGEVVSLAMVGTLDDSVLDGTVAVRGRGISLDGEGAIDLAGNEFEGLELEAALLDSELFGPGLELDDAVLRTTLDGPFRDLSAPLELSIGRLDAGGTVLAGLRQRGTLSYDGTRWTLPLNASVERIISGNQMIDPRLVDGTLTGMLVLNGDQLLSDDLALRFPGLRADLTLRGDIARGGYALAGPVELRGLALENLGTIDAGAQIRFMIGNGVPWRLAANFTGRMPRITNSTLANLTGGNVRFNGAVTLGAGRPVVFENTRITGNNLTMTLDGRIAQDGTTIAGRGRHVQYGPFTVEGTLTDAGPRLVLVFQEPLASLGLKNVRVTLEPTPQGFRIVTTGESMLGAFEGEISLFSSGGATRIDIERLTIGGMNVAGDLTLGEGGVAGTLTLSGAGIDGTVQLARRNGGQAFDVALTANGARFAGPTPLLIREGTLNASGFIGNGGWTVNGQLRAAGVNYGSLFLGRVVAQADIDNGRGTFQAALSGRRGSRFNLQVAGNVAPDRIAIAARGDYAGREIRMPRRAVLLKTADGGWALQKTQLSFGDGFIIAEGSFGGTQPAQGRISLADMPLSLVDVFMGDLGVGGTVSGIIDFGSGPNGVPTGEARVMVDNLTRSGLVLSSRPIDLALVARLTPTQLQTRAVLQDESGTKGRLQALISGLPASGGLMDRLYAGDLFAQLRYDGPADALWRLSTIELFDVTGPIRVAADVTGSLREPRVRGSVAGDDLRIQSPLTGSNIRGARVRGRFTGSRLNLTSFAGTAPNGGRVSGSGFVDLSDMTRERGPRIDLRIAARNAEILDLPNMGATVTGPMRIVSSGVGGTIAGRLQVEEARWQLGAAAATQRLPNIRTREINLPPDAFALRSAGAPWRFLIDANAPGGIEVDGMGLDSEWSAQILLRGTTENPRIGGEARVVPRQGFYSFAGTRFEITRGIIDFDENTPPDPRLNIVAETEVDNLQVRVSVTGNASRPMIDFTSIPALPEEELLARLLFGDSITNLSATDALQLGAAISSLRGGGGMDPINRLRTSIGLDRLRILPADAALDRGTAIALGKNFGRRFYAEIVTDGRGYNATELEFRVTSWLSLLASINTLGRGSVAAEYSHDY